MSYDATILANPNVLHYYKLDELEGPLALDSKGSADGVISGGVALHQAGYMDFQPAMLFDGSSGKITFASILVPGGLTPWSVDCWFNASALGGTILKVSNSTELYLTSGGELRMTRPDLVTPYAIIGTVGINQWHYASIGFDGVNSLCVILDDGGTGASGAMHPATGGTSEIGHGAAGYFNGLIQKVAFYQTSCGNHFALPEGCPTFNGFAGDPGLLGRSLPSGLVSALASRTPALCVCVRVTRKDNTVFGFTTHDEDLFFDALTFESLSSVAATTLRQQIGTGIDNMEILGLLSSDRITETDLRAGRFDNAAIRIYVVDWTNVANRSEVMRGRLGELTLTDGQYQAEVRSPMQIYSQQIGSLTSPLCRWRRFCDSNCALNIADFTLAGVVATLGSAPRLFTIDPDGGSWLGEPLAYTNGIIRATTGLNTGLEREVKSADGALRRKFELQEPFPFPLMVGDPVVIEMGCDRTLRQCVEYSNVVNFGGEPYIPGSDSLTRQGRSIA